MFLGLHAADHCDPVADKTATHAAVCCWTTERGKEDFAHATAPPSPPAACSSGPGDLRWCDRAKGDWVNLCQNGQPYLPFQSWANLAFVLG